MRALALPLLLLALPAAAEDLLERAVDLELRRSMTELHQEGYPRPYFLSLTVSDTEVDDWRCVMGAARASGRFRQRVVTPDLRVGGYELDNHPLGPSSAFSGRSVSQEDDEFALRYGLWRMLDASYKSASADFLRKQALRVRRGKTEYDTDDMTREPARLRTMRRPGPAWDGGALESLCAAASAEFRARPGLLHTDVGVKMTRHWNRLRDSDGTRVDFGRDLAEIELEAVDISTDGLRLYASRRFLIPAPAPLPRPEQLGAAAREMLADLEALKKAKSTSPFSAPALLDPSVAAAVTLAIGTRLTGEEERNPSGAQIFRDKLGKQVLPEDLTLEDDPTVPDHGGVPLAGSYEFDSQGIPAQKVTLIERGKLKGLLLSRFPVIGSSRSNGHGRAAPGVMPNAFPGTLFLRTRAPVSQRRLLDALRAECRRRDKPYGIWVRQLRSWSQQQGTGSQGSIRVSGLVYLVEAKTGALTLVRDLDLVGTPLALMGNILKAGDDARATSMMMAVPASAVVPSLLLSDAELQRAETKPEKAPILPPPPLP